MRDASNSGVGCSAVSSCTSPARSPGEQNIVGPQVLFSTLGPTDSDRRPRGKTGAPGRGNAGAHGVRRLAISGDSSGARGTHARDILPRPGGGQSSHSVEAATVLIGRADGGPDRAVFFFSPGRGPIHRSSSSTAMCAIRFCSRR